jgi:hypothetical protein
VCPTEEDSGMLMSSVCIVLLVLAVVRGGKGDRCWGWKDLETGQLTLGKRPARMGIGNHVQGAAIPCKGSFLA